MQQARITAWSPRKLPQQNRWEALRQVPLLRTTRWHSTLLLLFCLCRDERRSFPWRRSIAGWARLQGRPIGAKSTMGDQKSVNSNWAGLWTLNSRTDRPDLNVCACTDRVLARCGRCYLFLTALSQLTMPVTEHLWTWDRCLDCLIVGMVARSRGFSNLCKVPPLDPCFSGHSLKISLPLCSSC
jgi:hypothetical protein